MRWGGILQGVRRISEDSGDSGSSRGISRKSRKRFRIPGIRGISLGEIEFRRISGGFVEDSQEFAEIGGVATVVPQEFAR